MLKNLNILFILICFLAGCSSLPVNYPRSESFLFDTPEITTVGKIFSGDIANHPGRSGLLLLKDGKDALQVRNAMAGIAEKTIDVQYYIWHGDKSGRLLVQRLLEAADRGVRVRALLDDLTLDTEDLYLAAFDAHPNIEIRLFNPFAQRGFKGLGFITDLSRVNHRMHNKLFIMDNMLAVVGGRNVADQYYGIDEKYNFRDLDVLAAGPIVSRVSQSFDLFWNSEWAYPVSAVYQQSISAEQLADIRKGLDESVEQVRSSIPFDIDINRDEMYSRLQELKSKFIWSKVRLLFDTPNKVNDQSVSVFSQAWWLFNMMQHEFVAEVAYFIPGKRGVQHLRTLVDRGVNVRVLTNSYASNDVAPAHAGYETYRRRLLKSGVQLYEYKVDADERYLWPDISHTAESRLHTKTFVIDQKYIFIGSYNSDPRSKRLNTEVGLLIEDEGFAKQVLAYLNTGIDMSNSYQVKLRNGKSALSWTCEERDKIKSYTKDPKTNWWQRFIVSVLRLLPIEGQL